MMINYYLFINRLNSFDLHLMNFSNSLHTFGFKQTSKFDLSSNTLAIDIPVRFTSSFQNNLLLRNYTNYSECGNYVLKHTAVKHLFSA